MPAIERRWQSGYWRVCCLDSRRHFFFIQKLFIKVLNRQGYDVFPQIHPSKQENFGKVTTINEIVFCKK